MQSRWLCRGEARGRLEGVGDTLVSGWGCALSLAPGRRGKQVGTGKGKEKIYGGTVDFGSYFGAGEHV